MKAREMERMANKIKNLLSKELMCNVEEQIKEGRDGEQIDRRKQRRVERKT